VLQRLNQYSDTQYFISFQSTIFPCELATNYVKNSGYLIIKHERLILAVLRARFRGRSIRKRSFSVKKRKEKKRRKGKKKKKKTFRRFSELDSEKYYIRCCFPFCNIVPLMHISVLRVFSKREHKIPLRTKFDLISNKKHIRKLLFIFFARFARDLRHSTSPSLTIQRPLVHRRCFFSPPPPSPSATPPPFPSKRNQNRFLLRRVPLGLGALWRSRETLRPKKEIVFWSLPSPLRFLPTNARAIENVARSSTRQHEM